LRAGQPAVDIAVLAEPVAGAAAGRKRAFADTPIHA
jgi:hypothetical protein